MYMSLCMFSLFYLGLTQASYNILSELLDTPVMHMNMMPPQGCQNCNSFDANYMINQPDLCRTIDPFLIALVASSPQHVLERSSIRQSWGSVAHHHGQHLRTIFFMGTSQNPTENQKVIQESIQYRDVIQLDFTNSKDSPSAFSIAMVQWASSYCSKAKFIYKTEDDNYNDLTKLVEFLMLDFLPEPFIGGHCQDKFLHHNSTNSFWRNIFTSVRYPEFCSGSGYVLSMGAITKILHVYNNVQFFQYEDVYMTGFCREAANMGFKQLNGFQVDKSNVNSCSLKSWIVNIPAVTPSEMALYWYLQRSSDHSDCTCPYRKNRLLFFSFIFLIIGLYFLTNRRKQKHRKTMTRKV